MGNNFEISINDIVKSVEKITNIKTQIIRDPSRVRPASSEVNRLKCSNKKIKKILNWKIRLERKKGFEFGLKNTIEWVRNNKEKFLKDKIKNYII